MRFLLLRISECLPKSEVRTYYPYDFVVVIVYAILSMSILIVSDLILFAFLCFHSVINEKAGTLFFILLTVTFLLIDYKFVKFYRFYGLIHYFRKQNKRHR